jgi:hypothetical protein
MLLALCHRCWTWMEPKHERCVECGGVIQLQEPDPSPDEIRALMGPSLGVLGEVSLKRPRLPSFGTLSAHDNGLLFLPDLRELPTGAVAAIEEPNGRRTPRLRSSFWNLFSRKSAATAIETAPAVRPALSESAAAERFLDSPGAMFVRRETIIRLIQRGALLRVERKPGRTVGFRIESSPIIVADHVRRLGAHSAWSGVAVTALG